MGCLRHRAQYPKAHSPRHQAWHPKSRTLRLPWATAPHTEPHPPTHPQSSTPSPGSFSYSIPSPPLRGSAVRTRQEPWPLSITMVQQD